MQPLIFISILWLFIIAEYSSSITFFSALPYYLKLFRYNDDAEYDTGSVLGTNWWKTAGRWHRYTKLVVT